MVSELCLFALVTNTSAAFVYTAESAVLWERTNFPFEEGHVIGVPALPVCAWADAVQQDDLVKVSGVILPWSSSGSYGDKSLLCLYVFFKISSHIRCSSLGRFCLGCFFWARTHFMQTLEVTNRASSGIVLKMESMVFSGTVEQKCHLFSVSYLNWFGFLVLIMRMNYMLHYDKLIFF